MTDWTKRQPGREVVSNAIDPGPNTTVQLTGLLGHRLDAMRMNRLQPHEDEFLLWPFREPIPVIEDGLSAYPPGVAPHPEVTRGDWHGEFIGTWVAAAGTIAANADDRALMAKVDGLVQAWLDLQQPDGYLGTFSEQDRWKSWDLWVQAHDILGLVTHYEVTGSEKCLVAAGRVADRILVDFGPGRLSMGKNGPHGGMASSAIIEPLLWLYRHTGNEHYLDFCKWLVEVDWEQEGGPKILSILGHGGDIADIANGKAAEMLINFAGLLELYRVTGKRAYLDAVVQGWETINRHYLYITGSASAGEYFDDSHVLPNDGCALVGETCVTMSWIVLNVSLGRLTGLARYFDAAEQAIYNHLLGAQSPDGRGWAYYVGLRDAKRYRWHTDPECCPTRGTRALALLPAATLGTDSKGVVVNFFEDSEAELRLADGHEVRVQLQTAYPFGEDVRILLLHEEPVRFALSLRIPAWCEEWSASVGEEQVGELDSRGYLTIEREWRDGDELMLRLRMPPRVLGDLEGNRGKAAVVRGPLVFAADQSFLPDGVLLDDLTLDLRQAIVEESHSSSVRLRIPLVSLEARGESLADQRYAVLQGLDRLPGQATLVPFFEAGNTSDVSYLPGIHSCAEPGGDIQYQVWLPVSELGWEPPDEGH